MRIHIFSTAGGAAVRAGRSMTTFPRAGATGGRILLATALWFAGGLVPASADDAAERRLREDRARFQREIDRQAAEAKARETAARAAEADAKNAEQIERLRAQQAAHDAQMQRLKQEADGRTETRISRGGNAAITGASNTPVTSVAVEGRRSVGAVPDFSVTLLADGTCVVHRKGRAPEVKTIAEAREIFQTLVDGAIEGPAVGGPSQSKESP